MVDSRRAGAFRRPRRPVNPHASIPTSLRTTRRTRPWGPTTI
jgi:hypothetical protein